MKEAEYKEMKERIAAADTHKRAINQLNEAADRITDVRLSEIIISVKNNSIYSTNSDGCTQKIIVLPSEVRIADMVCDNLVRELNRLKDDCQQRLDDA